ncbi:MAG TPA: hypothetical protein PLX15_00520 [Candidatus Woesearchaeota archaeon]|nr:hypothetical protein [Candidatus Woesearchaeota archaeon]
MDIRELYKDTAGTETEFDGYDCEKVYRKGTTDRYEVMQIGPKTKFLRCEGVDRIGKVYRITTSDRSDKVKAIEIEPTEDLLKLLEMMHYLCDDDDEVFGVVKRRINTSDIRKWLGAYNRFEASFYGKPFAGLDDPLECSHGNFYLGENGIAYAVDENNKPKQYDEKVFLPIEVDKIPYLIQSIPDGNDKKKPEVYKIMRTLEQPEHLELEIGKGKIVQGVKISERDLVDLVLFEFNKR